MRVRNSVIAAAILAVGVSLPSVGLAQGQAPGSPPAPAPPPSTVRATPKAPPAVPAAAPPADAHKAAAGTFLPGVEHVFTPPVVLGPAWARALRAVLDEVKHVVEPQRLAVEPARPAGTPPAVPSVPAWRAVWLPAHAVREAIAASPVQVGPVSAGPPTETGRDTRGEHAVLLGAQVGLPWMVP